MNIEKIKEKCRRNQGIYDTKKYRYQINTTTWKLERVELEKLDTTAMLQKDAWQVME